MNGPFDSIPYDGSYSTMIDWEAELAVVIGKKGKNISEDTAMDYVFGYSAYNDTTTRDVQQKCHSGQWFKGKSLDGHGLSFLLQLICTLTTHKSGGTKNRNRVINAALLQKDFGFQ